MSPEINAASASQQSAPAAAAAAPAVQRADEQKLPELAVATQVTLQPSMPAVQFAEDPESGKVIARVVNPDTGDLVRQIPSEDALALARALGRLQGVFVEQKA